MITKELVEKYNGIEIDFKLRWMSRKVNCVVLVDIEKGASIKPYFIDDKEREIFINDRMNRMSKSREETIKDIEQDTYCLLQIFNTIDEKCFEGIINSQFADKVMFGVGSPVCQFA